MKTDTINILLNGFLQSRPKENFSKTSGENVGLSAWRLSGIQSPLHLVVGHFFWTYPPKCFSLMFFPGRFLPPFLRHLYIEYIPFRCHYFIFLECWLRSRAGFSWWEAWGPWWEAWAEWRIWDFRKGLAIELQGFKNWGIWWETPCWWEAWGPGPPLPLNPALLRSSHVGSVLMFDLYTTSTRCPGKTSGARERPECPSVSAPALRPAFISRHRAWCQFPACDRSMQLNCMRVFSTCGGTRIRYWIVSDSDQQSQGTYVLFTGNSQRPD